MRLLPSLALLLGTVLTPALATPANVGASAFIDPAGVIITPLDGPFGNTTMPETGIPANDTVPANNTVPTNDTVPTNITQLIRAADSIEYAFVVPINIFKGASPDDFAIVNVYLQEYDGDETVDVSQQEYFVYQDFVYFDGQYSSFRTARFNCTVSSTNNTVLSLRAQVVTETMSTFSAGSAYIVASHNASTGMWLSETPETYEAQVNEVITAEFVALDAQSDPGEDTTSETVIDDQDPDLPAIDSIGIDVNSTLPGSQNTTLPGGGNTTLPGGGNTTLPGGGDGGDSHNGSTTTPCKTKKHKPTLWMGMPEHPDPKPWVHHPHSKPKDLWDTKPCTTTPLPTPSPPCETDKDKYEEHWRYARQAKSTSILPIRLSFGANDSVTIPIRQLPVYAYGQPSNGGKAIKATGKTNNRGEVFLRWKLAAGQSVTVSKVYVTLDGEAHRIVTKSKDKTKFLTRYIYTTKVNYKVSAGQTSDVQLYRFKAAVIHEYLNLHERVRAVHYYAKTQMANFKKDKIAVWYPGQNTDDGTSFFQEANPPFISIAPNNAKNTTTIAHEYGHWFHYLVRGKKELVWGGSHSFCNATVPESKTLAFGEGFATAFAIVSMRNSPYKPGTGTGYCWSASDDPNPPCLDIEEYYCSAIPLADRDLSTDEGRVAAALVDLVDSTVDNTFGLDPYGVANKTDNSNLPAVKVLVRPMVKNPGNMEQYW